MSFTGKIYTPYRYLTGLANKLNNSASQLPIIEHAKDYELLTLMGFDLNALMGKNGQAIRLQPKVIKGINPTLTMDGTRVVWGEREFRNPETTISTTEANKALGTDGILEIQVQSAHEFAVNDKVHITLPYTNGNIAGVGDQLDGLIIDISNDNKKMTILVDTVNLQQFNGTATTVNLLQDQRVIQGANLRNDNEYITRMSNLSGTKEYASNFQHFGRKLVFTKTELNRVYYDFNDAAEFCQAHIDQTVSDLIHEIAISIYKGRNVGPHESRGGKVQMLGLEKVVMDLGHVHDLNGSVDPLEDLIRIMMDAQRSGTMMGTNKVSLVVNYQFLAELMLQSRFQLIEGGQIEALEFAIPVISTPFGRIEILQDRILSELYTEPVAYILPMDMISLWFRENTCMDASFKAKVNKASAGFNFVHIPNPGLHEKCVFDIYTEVGLIAAGQGGSNSPYHLIVNYRHT